jgi:hypothetical protein
MTLEYRTDAPAYTVAKWEGGKVVNDDMMPLWSGKGPLPAVGSEVVCDDRKNTVCVVLGYMLEDKWLMVVGHRKGEPNKIGTLAGAEIRWSPPRFAALRRGCDCGRLASPSGACVCGRR